MNEVIHQDFQMKQGIIQAWLEYLLAHHPTFHSHQVVVDHECINQLPENDLVHDRLCNIESQYMDDVFQDVGPPETSDGTSVEQNDPLYSAGFVPNMQDT